MRRAISIILAAILLTTPLKQVVAQAVQQEAATVLQTTAQDSSSHRLIRVPPATVETSPLWEPAARRSTVASLLAADSVYDGSAAVSSWSDISTEAKVGLIVIAVALLVALIVVLSDADKQDVPGPTD